MKRWSTRGILGVFCWALGLASVGFGQAEGQTSPANLSRVAHQMAGLLRHLAVDIETDLGQDPQGRRLAQDTQELAQSVGEFELTLQTTTDRFQIRQNFAGLDGTWHSLQAQLVQPAFATPNVNGAVVRIAEFDTQIHQSLGLRVRPATYYGNGPAPSGIAETQRLAHALADRSETLAAVVRVEMAGQEDTRLVQETVRLTQSVTVFYDSIDANATVEVVRNGYAGVAALADQIDQDVAVAGVPPRVQSAWQAFESTDVLLRQNLGLRIDAQDLPGTAIPATGPSPVVALADQLAGQEDAFVRTFSENAGAVPEGGLILADAQRLRAVTETFRQGVANGLAPGQLAYQFRDVDALWQRLSRRVNRIAQGRTGPNIQQVNVIGGVCAQVHRLLGMPGYRPVPAVIVVPE